MSTTSNKLGQNQHIPWSVEEELFLTAHYAKMGPKWCSQNIGTNRSDKAVNYHARKRMELYTDIRWTISQEQYLRENYGMISAKEIAHVLNKKEESIIQKAYNLGINCINFKPWIEEEKEIIRKYYPSAKKGELLKMLPRHSYASIKHEAQKIGVTKRCRTDQILADIEMMMTENNECLYWLGFLLADGHFSKNNRLRLTLATKDREHLLKFADFIKFRGKIQEDDIRISVSVMDYYWINLLKIKYDLDNRKTYNPPDVNKYRHLSDDQIMSLIVGFIDGDGSIVYRKKTKTCNLVIKNHITWRPFLDFFAERIESISDIKLTRATVDKRGYALIAFSNHLLNKFLKNETIRLNLPVLTRKWERIDENHINPYELCKQRTPIVLSMLRAGVLYKDIAHQTGLSSAGISKIAKANGLSRR